MKVIFKFVRYYSTFKSDNDKKEAFFLCLFLKMQSSHISMTLKDKNPFLRLGILGFSGSQFDFGLS